MSHGRTYEHSSCYYSNETGNFENTKIHHRRMLGVAGMAQGTGTQRLASGVCAKSVVTAELRLVELPKAHTELNECCRCLSTVLCTQKFLPSAPELSRCPHPGQRSAGGSRQRRAPAAEGSGSGTSHPEPRPRLTQRPEPPLPPRWETQRARERGCGQPDTLPSTTPPPAPPLRPAPPGPGPPPHLPAREPGLCRVAVAYSSWECLLYCSAA